MIRPIHTALNMDWTALGRVTPHTGFSFSSDDEPRRDIDSTVSKNYEAVVGFVPADRS
jgi:hypothetical protein